MSRVLRANVRVSYAEIEEPSFDEYLFCSSCGDYVYEYCAIHGPLLVIPDSEVPNPTGFPAFVPRAALTIPSTFLHLAPSTIPGAGLGVFSSLTLPRGVRFGPYRGIKTDEVSSPYCWQIFDRSHKPALVLDARDANKSNWMRYVNCSRHNIEQNLVAYQYYGQLYYRTIKIIPRFTELFVFYGSESACELNIDVRRYNAPAYTELVKFQPKKKEHADGPSTIENNTDTLKVNDEENMQLNQEMHDNSNDTTSIVNLKNTVKKDSNEYKNRAQNEIYICDYCGKRFNNKDILITHIASHNTAKLVALNKRTIQKPSCLICGCKFSKKTDLINHLINIHDSKVDYKACSQCHYKTVNARHLRNHIERHSIVRKYNCDICEYVGVTKGDLTAHKRWHATGQCSCPTCGLKYPNKKKLNLHVMSHTEDRPYACNVCGMAFKYMKYLKKHQTTHSMREKPFKCQTCFKCFYRSSTLKQHTKLH